MKNDYELYAATYESGEAKLILRSYFDDAIETAERYWTNAWYHVRVYDTVNKFDVWEDGEYLL